MFENIQLSFLPDSKIGVVVFNGTEWVEPALETASVWGINASANAYSRRAARAPASLFDCEGGGHQIKINKASDSDTASVLFQSGYSGRAEIGLMGNGGFGVKVSQNGQGLEHALLIDQTNGNVGIGTTFPTTRLHVDGPLRIGRVSENAHPHADLLGEGSLLMLDKSDGETVLLLSDGAHWLRILTAEFSG